MRTSQVIAACLLVLVGSACQAQSESTFSCQGSVVVSGTALGFSGCISAEAAEVFISAADRQPEVVVIESSGGDVSAAIRMASAISRNRLRLVIRGGCFSSCANYLVPASPVVAVERDAFVGFHGDVRLTIHRLSAADQVGITMMEEHKKILAEELQFAESHPRAARLHDLQAVASAPTGVRVSSERYGESVSCPGQGQVPWLPALDLLLRLNLIDAIVDRNEKLLPSLPQVDFGGLRSRQATAVDPMKGCSAR